MIKKEQELRVALTGVTEVPFDIVKNPIFKSTQNVVISAMRRSVARGVCKERKKSSVLGVTLEQEILHDIDFSIKHSRGCQSRFAFFCMLHFCVRGGLELYKLERAMFARGADELGPFVRFSERLTKNYKVDLMHYQPEYFRPAVTVRDSDVLDTFDQLMLHMPPIVEGDKNLLHVFLQPISSPRTQTWYNRNRVSVKVLSGLVKFICERSGIGGNFSNKSLRSTSVTRMSLGQVPPDVGMLVTGHKRATSYEKYDLSSEVRIAAAQDILSHPYDDSGKLKAYPQVLKEKFNNFCQNVEGASRDIREDVCPLSAGLLSVGSVDNNVGGESKSKISCGHLSNSVDKVASGKSKLTSSDGICFGSYKLGDDIPFDEKLLQDLPPESARAVGIVPRSPGVSMFPSCNMHNCVVNVYLGKENTLPGKDHLHVVANARSQEMTICLSLCLATDRVLTWHQHSLHGVERLRWATAPPYNPQMQGRSFPKSFHHSSTSACRGRTVKEGWKRAKRRGGQVGDLHVEPRLSKDSQSAGMVFHECLYLWLGKRAPLQQDVRRGQSQHHFMQPSLLPLMMVRLFFLACARPDLRGSREGDEGVELFGDGHRQ
ncbi:hypothetical protein GOP47_0021599 [Adiantum capillus-veneris]|uniref:Uncharacterized protein n=1 Tax=Adiantum capillus-veneris TaxID=13818 RepID=A0A9D4Z743_ADICA|nr:hypothetical protein GOP47_0021599 [Adiantum capillus-veneris]